MYVCYEYFFEEFADENVFYFLRNIIGFVFLLLIFEEVEEIFFFLFQFGLYYGFLLQMLEYFLILVYIFFLLYNGQRNEFFLDSGSYKSSVYIGDE